MSALNRRAIRERFGDAVRRRRRELGLSQEGLAERAHLHRTYLSDVERGNRNPSLESITRIAAALDLEPSALLRLAEGGPTEQGVG